MKKAVFIISLLVIANSAYAQKKEITRKKGESVTLTSVGGSGKAFQWYADSCGGTFVGKGNKVIVTPQKTTTYYGRWEDGNVVSTCIGVTVTVLEEPPVPPAVPPKEPVSDPKDIGKKPVTTETNSGSVSKSTKTYSFGKYVGGLKDGIPEGDGKLTYTRRVQIAKHDKDKNLKPIVRFAEAGDYFEGSWGNGDIVSGTLYDSNQNIKEKIFTSKRPAPYDISND